MKQGAPIRFLVLLIGGWACIRVAVLAPDWWSEDAAASPGIAARIAAGAPPSTPHSAPEPLAMATTAEATGLRESQEFGTSRPGILPHLASPLPSFPVTARSFEAEAAAPPAFALPLSASSGLESASQAPRPTPIAAMASPAPRGRRLTGSAWLLLRRDGGNASLAPGGTLGGSQAGMRLLYRLNDDPSRSLALSGRIYLPLRRTAGAEAAAGLDWRPSADAPIHLLLERRQRLGREGRSAFSISAYGGGSIALGGGWRLDGYAQVGVVGLRSREAFADGSARVSRPLGGFEIGGALWGAAQPGASRLDAGPHLTLPLQMAGPSLRLSAEYRFRITGDARPASGPALSLGVDF